VRPEPLQRFQDHRVGLFGGEVGVHDAVVIIDRDVPDHPPDLGVVALLCSRRAPERDQELLTVLLDSPDLLHILERVVAGVGLL
jgi:hypothetical protein